MFRPHWPILAVDQVVAYLIKWLPHSSPLTNKALREWNAPSIASLNLRIPEKPRSAKEKWHKAPGHHGTEEIRPHPPKKSCPGGMRNALARTVAQIRTGNRRSAVYLKRIRKMAEDKCWFCQSSARMTRSHVLLHYPNVKLRCLPYSTERRSGARPGMRNCRF
jgi:hypothetical protein